MIQRDDYLGDWQVKEITQHRVRLTNDIEVRLMQMRKTASAATQAVEG